MARTKLNHNVIYKGRILHVLIWTYREQPRNANEMEINNFHNQYVGSNFTRFTLKAFLERF